METFCQDVRYGLRMLWKSPGFTAVAIATLALGVGANTAMFSVVNGVLISPLGFSHEDQLVQLTDPYPQGAIVAMQESFHTMEIAGYRDGQELNLTGVGDALRLHGAAASANFFSLLGARPELGRTFLRGEDEAGRDNLVILSEALWRRRFNSDPNVIGRSIMLDGLAREVIGIIPDNFPLVTSQPQFWVPLHLDPRDRGSTWGGGFMGVVGRLRPGFNLDQARAELVAATPHLKTLFPWPMPSSLWADASVLPLQRNLVSDVRSKLLILLAAISLVLLIACANVANLLLTRATARQKELAMRAALGAGPWRICRQLLTESLLLGLAGAAAGLLLAAIGLSSLKALMPADTPLLASVGIDWRVLAFTFVIALTTGLVFGIVPALHSARADLIEKLRTGSQRSTGPLGRKLRSALAVTELSLAVVLVVGAGLMVKSLWKLYRVDPGFQTEAVLSARLTPDHNLCRDYARCQNFYLELLERARTLPEVDSAALVNVLPLSGRFAVFSAAIEDHPQAPGDAAPPIFENVVTPDYFSTLGVPLIAGRAFTAADMGPQTPAVALITADTARKYWPNQNPLGKHIKRVWDKDNWITIVGVVGDVHEASLATILPSPMEGSIYRPYGNAVDSTGHMGPTAPTAMTLVLRTKNDSALMAEEIERMVASTSPDVPITEVETLKTVLTHSISTPRSTMELFGIFALLALALGMVGVYAVISYGVTQRIPEIGVRLALGAQKRDVIGLVMRDGGPVTLIGLGIGIMGALVGTRLLSSFLFAVSTDDTFTYVAVSLSLAAVAMCACYIPARRAAKVDPMVALRYE